MTDQTEERIAIMTTDGGCTEEEAVQYVNSEECKASMDEWNTR